MKNKILLLVILLPLLLVSCGKDIKPGPVVPVTVTINNISVEGKATLDSAVVVKHLTLLFLNPNGNNIVHQSTQSRSDTNFGQFDIMLAAGTYNMVVLGYGGNDAVTANSGTSAVFPAPTQVFQTAQTVNVSTSGSNQLTAVLDRINASLVIRATDTIPPGVSSIRFSYAASSLDLNPLTGLANSNSGFRTSVIIPANCVNEVHDVTSNLLLFSDPQNMALTVDVLDASGNTVISHHFDQLSFRRNARTYVTGPLYHQGSSTGFTVNLDWLDSINGGTF